MVIFNYEVLVDDRTNYTTDILNRTGILGTVTIPVNRNLSEGFEDSKVMVQVVLATSITIAVVL